MNIFYELLYDDIANEGFGENVKNAQMKATRKIQTSKFGIANANIAQKNICEKKLDACNTPEACDVFITWLEKQKSLVQKKINGTEIKDKAGLNKMMSTYNEYLSKAKLKKTTVGSNSKRIFR